MTRRSYLSRIAQPLTPADPLVWSVPQPAADEARPGVETAPPTLRRTAAPAPTAGARSGPAAPAAAGSSAKARAKDAPASTQTAGIETIPAQTGHAEGRLDSGPLASAAPAASFGPKSPTVQGRHGLPASTAHGLGARDPRSNAGEASPETSWPSREETAASAPGRRPALAAPTTAEGPRLHIGTIEVRASAPPTPPPAPQAAPGPPAASGPAQGPIGRAYAWRFGLVQG